MSTKLPSVLVKTPMIDDNAILTPVWADWFIRLFERVGGNIASTNKELYSVSTIRIEDAAVTEAKLSSSIAGDGLSGAAGSPLAVNTDNSTIEINSDTLRVKDSGITLAKFASDAKASRIVQDVFTQSGAVATGTTTIPIDDTIPQNTEGTEFLSASITPQSASNRLVIDAELFLSASAANITMIAALFQDSTANSLAGCAQFVETSGGVVKISFRHEMAAGTTSATTFKVRAGAGSAATVTFNGSGGARLLGGINLSSLRITERTV